MKYPIALLNVSEFDSEWNRSVLDMAWREREAAWATRGARDTKKPAPGQNPNDSCTTPPKHDTIKK